MRRREFIGFVGGATALLPLGSRAQQQRTPVIGHLSSISKDADAAFREAFWTGLAEFGFFENQNATIIYRYAEGHYERMQALADELVARQVDIIVTGPSSPAALAAKHATSTIPIVFVLGADPVELGLVASDRRPGANVTGINLAPVSLTTKRLEMLNELVPGSFPIAEMVNPTNKYFVTEVKIASEAARTLGRELLFVNAGTAAEFAPAFEEIRQKHVVGLTLWFEALFQNHRDQIVSHMKEEIISGLTGEEVKIIIQSAAEVALDKARRQMQIISKGDPRIDAAQLKANVRSWCNTVATPFIRSVLVLHDQHHDLWDQAITQAKQNNSH